MSSKGEDFPFVSVKLSTYSEKFRLCASVLRDHYYLDISPEPKEEPGPYDIFLDASLVNACLVEEPAEDACDSKSAGASQKDRHRGQGEATIHADTEDTDMDSSASEAEEDVKLDNN